MQLDNTLTIGGIKNAEIQDAWQISARPQPLGGSEKGCRTQENHLKITVL